MSKYNLNLCNIGDKPTYCTSQRCEILDLTFKSSSNSIQVNDWQVSDIESFSD
ncbi:hypothetical protein, partial [Streptomyces sp. IBSBF 2390]|uniref:hypothetical protein n=1 Tax=Streptomyces sp. IBSBF 2390 TaxID=2903533 RepID=UPI003FA7399D